MVVLSPAVVLSLFVVEQQDTGNAVAPSTLVSASQVDKTVILLGNVLDLLLLTVTAAAAVAAEAEAKVGFLKFVFAFAIFAFTLAVFISPASRTIARAVSFFRSKSACLSISISSNLL